MNRPAKVSRLLVIASLAALAAGCVPQEKYNALKLDRDRLAEQLAAAQADSMAADARASSFEQQLQALMQGGGSKDQMIATLSAQNADLARQLQDLNERYAQVVGRSATGGQALPAPLSNELENLAREYSDIVEFDAARGILRFRNDVTFASGDATLTPRGREIVGRFAQILNGSARGYELIVAGHTDNRRVVQAETIRRGHKDNWYLSSHRAITVAQELMGQGVSAQRLAVTGYADQRPAEANTTEAGRARNRRVEVMILPNAVRTGATAGSRTAANPGLTRDDNK